MLFDMLDVKNLVTTFDWNEPTGDSFLDGRYQWQIDKFGHPKPYYRMFYRLAEVLNPEMVVELGGWRGTGAAHWAPHSGTVVTIDHHSDPGDDENKKWMLEASQNYNNFFYIQGWTWDVVDDVRSLGKYIRVLFIDSWHVYDKAMKDWNAYKDMLDPEGALVICDDLANDGPCIQLIEFWNEVSDGRENFVVEGLSTYPMGFFKWTLNE